MHVFRGSVGICLSVHSQVLTLRGSDTIVCACSSSCCLTDVKYDVPNIKLSAICRYGKFIFCLADLCGRYSCLKF